MKIETIFSMSLIVLVAIAGFWLGNSRGESIFHTFSNTPDLYGIDGSPQQISITQEDMNLLNDKFTSTNDEFVYCYTASQTDEGILLGDFTPAPTIQTSGEDVIFGSCPGIKTYYGTIHNHINGVCMLSKQDIYTYGYLRQQTAGIICNTNSIAFFGSHNPEIPLEVSIK